jgi:hypothetical protein
MTNKTSSKLNLRKETLRSLNGADLAAVRGGYFTTPQIKWLVDKTWYTCNDSDPGGDSAGGVRG